MEKYHYEDLEYAQAQDGKLKILLKEEVTEIAFLNDIKLDVIDTKAKQVLMAPDGSPQTINDFLPIVSCQSKRGEDCLKQVLKQDSKLDNTLHVDKGGGIYFRDNWPETAWTTQNVLSLDFSKKENLRDWIEVGLPPAPAGAKTAKLVVSASETGILSFAEVDWVNTSKENVELFFNLSDYTSFGDHWAKQIYRVVTPKIQIQNDKGKWVNYPDSSFDENIFSTYDTLVFPLDLSLVKGNKIRIESMAYTYIYDFVGVDYSNLDFTRHTISPFTAIFISPSVANSREESVIGKINKMDDERLTLLIQDQLELLFRLPPEDQSLNRSYHIQIAGYYQPSRRIEAEGTSFFKNTLNQIKREGLFGFIGKTGTELYDMIMTCTNFDYANRRFLPKYLQELKGKGIDPNSTFPLESTCGLGQEEAISGGSLNKDISILVALSVLLAGLIVLYRKKGNRPIKILIIIFALIILIFLIDSIIAHAACSGSLNCSVYVSPSTNCTNCSQCVWDAAGPCSGSLNCGAISASSTCTGCGQCSWDAQGPCSGSLNCPSYVSSSTCAACGQCAWDPEGPCPGSLSCSGLSEGNCTGCGQCSWTSSCIGTASVCSTHADQTSCSNCGCTWNVTPTVTGVSLNSGSNITTLIEGSTTSVTVIATTTDSNGYADISSVLGRIYRSGASGAPSCTLDDNNCYQKTSCATSTCSGNSCKATCVFSVWFNADPTDIGTWSGEKWEAWVQVTDSQGQTSSSTNSTETVDMTTLRALNVTNIISYGTHIPGNQTGTPILTTATTTGNSAIDISLSGTDMVSSPYTLSVIQQHYGTTTFFYASGTALSTTPVPVNLDLSKPTSHPSTSSANVYWHISIPMDTQAGLYTGVNTFEVIPAI
jgi:hypothetical protein